MLFYQGKYQDEITRIYIKDAKNIFSNKNTILLKDGSFYKIGTVSFKILIYSKEQSLLKLGCYQKVQIYKTIIFINLKDNYITRSIIFINSTPVTGVRTVFI